MTTPCPIGNRTCGKPCPTEPTCKRAAASGTGCALYGRGARVKPCPVEHVCRQAEEPAAAASKGSDHVWIGDLAGFEVLAGVDPFTRRPYVAVGHRCGWSQRVRSDGLAAEGSVLLSNLVHAVVIERPGHVCAEYSHG